MEGGHGEDAAGWGSGPAPHGHQHDAQVVGAPERFHRCRAAAGKQPVLWEHTSAVYSSAMAAHAVPHEMHMKALGHGAYC